MVDLAVFSKRTAPQIRVPPPPPHTAILSAARPLQALEIVVLILAVLARVERLGQQSPRLQNDEFQSLQNNSLKAIKTSAILTRSNTIKCQQN